MSSGARLALQALRREGILAPRILTLAITGFCNLHCQHCLVNAGEVSSVGHLPERTLRRLLSEFVELEGEGVCLTGGEPLCHPAWLRLLQFARSLRFDRVTLQTNGMLFTKDSVAALRQLDFQQLTIQVSLDGATAATHDLVRGVGAYAGVLAGLQQLIRGGLSQQITLCFTEMRHNLAEFPAVLELAASLGISSVISGTMVRSGRGSGSVEIVPPESAQYQQLLRRFATEPDLRSRYEQIGSMAALEWAQEQVPRSECCSFVEHPYLTAAGTLYPCVFCHIDQYAVQGVLGKSLSSAVREGASLWSTLLRQSELRATELAACRDCPGRMFCAGGCLGRAWAASGTLSAPDDRCAFRRAIYTPDFFPRPNCC